MYYRISSEIWDKKGKNDLIRGSLFTFDLTIHLEKSNYQNQIYGVFRLSKPFNLTYWLIKSDDLLQNPIRVPENMSQRSKSSDLVDRYIKLKGLPRRNTPYIEILISSPTTTLPTKQLLVTETLPTHLTLNRHHTQLNHDHTQLNLNPIYNKLHAIG